jgi:hypothetical protein
MNTPSEVGGVLARIADGLPQTLDAEGYQRLLTRAANHLLPLAHPPSDLWHAINSHRDAWSSINASRERRQLSRQWLQLVAQPGDGRDSTSVTPLHGTDTIVVDRRTHVEYLPLLHVSGPFSSPRTTRSPTSTNMSLSRTREAGWSSIRPLGQLKM